MPAVTALLAAFLALAPALGAPGAVRKEVLPNGLVVLLAEDHAVPLVAVGVMYRVGARNEAAGTTGLAHYVEHMAFRDTKRFPGSESTAAVTRLGGRWNGYTWIDQTWYVQTVPRESLGLALDIEADRMTAALFAPAEFAKERTSVIAELHSYDDPSSVLYDAVLAASFEIHPYRNNTIGYLTDVEAVTRDAAFAFYRRFYHPQNAVLAVVGDFDPGTALREVQARFGAIPQGGASTEVPTVEPLQSGQRRVTVRKPGPEARVLVAWRAPALADPDFAAMVLFDALLAGGKGFRFTRTYPGADGPLRRRVAEAESDWQASRYPYVYTLAASAPEAAALPALESQLLAAVAEAAARGWSEAEMETARRQVRAAWAADLDDLPGRAHQLAFFEVSGGHEYLLDMPERLAAVGVADLRRFAGARLKPDQATVGWFVPGEPVAAPATGPPPAPRASAPAPAAPAPAAPGPAAARRELSLPNAVQVVLEPSSGAGLVALRARLDAGSLYDGATPGLSAVATEILARPAEGEPAAPPLVWSLHAEPAGAGNARWLEAEGVGLADQAPALLRVLGGRLRAAQRPTAEALKHAREAAARRARTLDADREADLWRRGREALYPASAPGRGPAWGGAEAVASLTDEQVRAFLARYVRPDRARVVLAGDVAALSGDEVAAALASERPPTGGLSLPRPVAPAGPAAWEQRVVPWPGAAQNEIAVLWAGHRKEPADGPATEMILYLLGETGYAGRLGRALVEPGLVYSVYATLEEAPGTEGFLRVRTAAAPRDTPEVLARIRRVLEEAAQGAFTEADLAEARAYLRGKRLRARDGSVAAAAAAMEAPWARAQAFEAVTLSQLRAAAGRLGARGAPLALVAGPGLP
ncbi:MAG TPA: insulinase family protein [Vicinamibacteria bacterium]